MNEYAHYDGKAHKLLSDNRAADFAEQYAREQALDALIPSTDDWRA